MSGAGQAEQHAFEARQSYMELGAGVQLGSVPAAELQELAAAVEGIRLPDYAAFDAGWLEAETAISTFRAHPDGDWDERFAPLALFARARERWEKIYENSAANAEFRSRAELAAGSLAVYEASLGETPVFRHKLLWDRQVPAAATILREYDRRNNEDLTHELHCQTLMLLAGSFFYKTNTIIVPTPSRFQDLGNERRYDMLYCVFGGKRGVNDALYYLRMAAREGGFSNDCIVLPPSMLHNKGYEPRAGHGTLRALLETINLRKMTREGVRLTHLAATYTAISKSVSEQVRTIRGMRLDADPVTGLADARRWYEELSPLYHVVEADKPGFEACINAHEYALGTEETTAEDVYRLGWLWMELASLPGESSGFDRAIQVFEMAAEASSGRDWPLYIRAKAAVSTAKLYQQLYGQGEITPQGVTTYRNELAALAQETLTRFPDAKNPSYTPKIQEVVRALAVCQIINTDPEASHLAVLPSLRQNPAKDDAAGVGSHVQVIPYVADAYTPNAVGRLRFDSSARNTLDQGVATLEIARLKQEGWHDDLAMLRATIQEVHRLQTEEAFEADELIERLRILLVTHAARTMSI